MSKKSKSYLYRFRVANQGGPFYASRIIVKKSIEKRSNGFLSELIQFLVLEAITSQLYVQDVTHAI